MITFWPYGLLLFQGEHHGDLDTWCQPPSSLPKHLHRSSQPVCQWNPWCSVDRYELQAAPPLPLLAEAAQKQLQARRPRGPPMRFADLESLRLGGREWQCSWGFGALGAQVQGSGHRCPGGKSPHFVCFDSGWSHCPTKIRRASSWYERIRLRRRLGLVMVSGTPGRRNTWEWAALACLCTAVLAKSQLLPVLTSLPGRAYTLQVEAETAHAARDLQRQ